MATLLLLIGPQTMGKTTIFNAAHGEENPDKMETTQNVSKCKKICSGSYIRDTPGSNIYRTPKEINKMIDNGDLTYRRATHIGFVFNIKDFLQELDHPEQGGAISSAMMLFWHNFVEELSNEDNIYYKIEKKNIHFIGTFADQVKGDACELIRTKMEDANEAYIKIAGQLRYPYFSHFKNNANIHCLNATNVNEVKALINQIFKES